MDKEQWLNKAALCEALALGLRLPTPELAGALASGEFSDALVELGEANGLDSAAYLCVGDALKPYAGQDADALFHALRIDYTRLFVGSPQPVASPFAGVWHAAAQGVEPLLFVNRRSMDVERYLRKYGVGQAEGTNEPLDHIATMLEFLQYLALVNAQAVLPPEGVDIPEDAFRGFIEAYLVDWVGEFAQALSTSTGEPLYQTMAQFLQAVLARFAQGHPN